MVGKGCDDRISDDPKRGGVCNSDVIGQAEEGGGEDWKMGKLPRHHVYGPFCLHFFIPVYKHTLNSCFYQRKMLLLFSTLYSKLFMAISTLSLRE